MDVLTTQLAQALRECRVLMIAATSSSEAQRADAHAREALAAYDAARAPTPLPVPAKEPDTEEGLCAVYEAWIKSEGLEALNLGSADEHYFDPRLSTTQRQWLIDYGERWEEMLEAQDEAARIDRIEAESELIVDRTDPDSWHRDRLGPASPHE